MRTCQDKTKASRLKTITRKMQRKLKMSPKYRVGCLDE